MPPTCTSGGIALALLHRKAPLLASLQAAFASFERGGFKSGVNQLTAFQHQLSAQVASEDADLATQWIEAAEWIQDFVKKSAGVRIRQIGPIAELRWKRGVLQEAENILGPWRDVPVAGSPHQVAPASGSKFYRVRTE